MSADMVHDMYMMHNKFGVHEWFENNKHDKDLMRKFLAFRLMMQYEELGETMSAALVQGNSEEVVDGLIDTIVFALGTLDIMGVDTKAAWDQVYEANMAKQPGVKPGRPNKFGLPDLLKPAGWKAPSHAGNHGLLPEILK
jgi:hypothetical protein